MQVKGKAEPLALYRPLAARARFGSDVTRTHGTPLVGRELETALLIGTFERSARRRACQLVTIVGEPGVGKSRLMRGALRLHRRIAPELVRWRQGRCLPYGEGIAFWALGEIVKAEAASSSPTRPTRPRPSSNERSPTRAGPRLAQGPPRAARRAPRRSPPRRGVVRRLAALPRRVAAQARPCSSSKTCTGPTRRCSPSSSTSPLGAGRAASPPLHRPARAGRAASRPGRRRCATHTIELAPLTRRETARWSPPSSNARYCRPRPSRRCSNGRVETPCTRRSSCACSQTAASSAQASPGAGLRAGTDRRPAGHPPAGAKGPAPGRRRDRQGLLGGRAGGDGERDPREVEIALHELARKELVRPARTTAMAGEARVRLLAPPGPGRLLRADPARRSCCPPPRRRSLDRAPGGERAEDLADVLAYHYLSALELSAPPPAAEQEHELEATVRYLALAGERALGLDVDEPRRASPGARARPGRRIPSAPASSSAGRRPRCCRAGSRRREPRSKRRSPSTASRARAGRRAGADRACARARPTGRPRHEEAIAEALARLEARRPAPSSSRRMAVVGLTVPRRAPSGRRSRPPSKRSPSPPSSAWPNRRTLSAPRRGPGLPR